MSPLTGKKMAGMHPFREGDTSATFGNLQRTIIGEINALQNDYVAKASLSPVTAVASFAGVYHAQPTSDY